jgi:polyisoprenoid-binding protein YceI/Flp pilus assembly protein TadD
MKKLLTLAALVPALAASQPAKPRALQVYRLDAGHSIVEFSIGFAFSRIKGRFVQSHGTILYDPVDPSNSSVTVIIETPSIDTGWPHRDEHLRTSDFFDVEKYPTITFSSTRLRRSGDAWIADGSLTMHGVTRSVSIPFHLLRSPTRSPESHWMILNTAGGMRLARKDFGITGGDTYNSWFDKARAATMADSVEINLEVEGYLSDAESQRVPSIVAALERMKTNGVQAEIARLQGLSKGKSAQEWNNYFTGADYRVRALIGAGQTADALKFASALPELFPGNANALAVYGYALGVSGNMKAAAEQYAKSRQIFKPTPPDDTVKFKQVDNNWYYMDQLVRTSLEWGRIAPAVPLGRHITELYPDNAEAYATYGWALAMSGDFKNALIQYEKALKIDPNNTCAIALKRRIAN